MAFRWKDLPDTSTPLNAVNLNSLIDIFYPVGSYYETSDNNFDPNTEWTGTWVEDSKGYVTVAKDSTQTEFDIIGKTGGSKYLQEHTHIGNPGYGNMYFAGGSEQRWLPLYGDTTYPINTQGVKDITTGNSGNLQPYIVVKRWHRTA